MPPVPMEGAPGLPYQLTQSEEKAGKERESQQPSDTKTGVGLYHTTPLSDMRITLFVSKETTG